MTSRAYTFIGGDAGPWHVHEVRAVVGASLAPVGRLQIVNEHVAQAPTGAHWLIRGVTSHGRYTPRHEQDQLAAVQPAIGQPEATCAALIPITKNAAWWALTQDERLEIFGARSSHTPTGMAYLPAIARRLHHGRDLGEPFDFLTWFEYAPADADAFEELVAALRRTEEWTYVEREVDIRLTRVETVAG